MSTTKIQFNLNIAGTPTDATSVVFRDPTSTFGVRRTDTLATVVAAGVALTHDATGEYSYTFTDPASNLTYNYWVEFVYAGNTYRVEQNISGSTSPTECWNYTTKALVANFAKIPEADLRDEWCCWAEDLIDEYVGTSYTGQVTYTNEMHDGDGSSFLFVNHPPLASVSALSISGGEMIPSDYKIYETYIELAGNSFGDIGDALYQPRTFPEGVGNILISYVGLSASVPSRVQLAATQMVAMVALVNQREGADASLKYSRVTTTQGDTTTTTAQVGLQRALRDIMEKYLPPKVRVM